MSEFDVKAELNRLREAIREDFDEVQSLVLESGDLNQLIPFLYICSALIALIKSDQCGARYPAYGQRA